MDPIFAQKLDIILERWVGQSQRRHHRVSRLILHKGAALLQKFCKFLNS